MLILIQEDGPTAHLYTQLLDALLVVHGQQERLEASLGLDGKHDGEILWENSPCRTNNNSYVTYINGLENKKEIKLLISKWIQSHVSGK